MLNSIRIKISLAKTVFFFFLYFSSAASSRLGRALAELFGLLVKLCVGSPVRQRRSHHTTNTGTAPTPAARATASSLTKLLTKGLSWQPPPYTPTPRFRYSVNSRTCKPHQSPFVYCCTCLFY